MSSSPQSSNDSTAKPPSFRLKGGLFPMTLLEIAYFDSELFSRDLAKKVAEAPAFFQQTPVILSLDSMASPDTVVLTELVALCRKHGLVPVGLRGATENLQQQAQAMGMALMAEGRAKSNPSTTDKPESDEGEQAANEAISTAPAELPNRPSRIITTPIRSGQQVYAAGGDLIVLAQVSAGAEILADGNIHVYGTLRGRALAGVQGDTSARIFCQNLEAELISIAGHFKLDEDLRGDLWKHPVQIALNEQTLDITPLV